jgi:hypothetical protein
MRELKRYLFTRHPRLAWQLRRVYTPARSVYRRSRRLAERLKKTTRGDGS